MNTAGTTSKLNKVDVIRPIIDGIGSALPVAGDLVDSGVTLEKVTRHLKENFINATEVKSSVIWTKGCSSIRPDYSLEDLSRNPWIHQPFEDYDGLHLHQILVKLTSNRAC